MDQNSKDLPNFYWRRFHRVTGPLGWKGVEITWRGSEPPKGAYLVDTKGISAIFGSVDAACI
jgi:hypothetical protein